MLTLRPYQVALKTGAQSEFLKGHRAVLLVAPTGGGKTVIFCDMGAETARREKRVLILVHRVELIRQTLKKIAWTGARVGVIQRKFKPDLGANIQIASVGSLANRLSKIPYKFDLIIVDEAHHATAGTWAKIINYYPKSRILGVTATPQRTDGSGLSSMFDTMFVGEQYAQLIEDGYLVKPLVFAPSQKVDLTQLRMRLGDYVAEDVEKEFNKPSVTGDAVKHYKQLCDGRPAIVFCNSVKHAEDVAKQFRDAGYKALAVDGNIDDKLRERVLSDDGMLVTGELQIVTSCSLIDEGTDVPVVFATIHLRPTQSLIKWLQQTGRASRPIYAPGFDLDTREGRLAAIAASEKPHAIILDHAGNCFVHGMPDDPREWSLVGYKESRPKGVKSKPKVAQVRQCIKCYHIHNHAPKCPQCDYEYPIAPRVVEEIEGELEAIVSPELKKFIALNARNEVQKLRTLDDLKEYGIKKGYKPGWALHMHASRNKKQTGI